MARVRLLEKEDVDPMVKEIYQKVEESGGEVINLIKALAHSPKICRDWNRLGITLLLKGQLSPKLRELAILRVGVLAKANYEWTKHVPMAMAAGTVQEQIDSLPEWVNSKEFNEQERVVLRYTDEVSQDIRASDDTFSKIREFLSEREIIELTVTIGYYGMVCRTLESLQIELEHE
jgi:4-carboxymuconolactone decarboxylase